MGAEYRRECGAHAAAPHAAFDNDTGHMAESARKFQIMAERGLKDHGVVGKASVQATVFDAPQASTDQLNRFLSAIRHLHSANEPERLIDR